MEIKALTGLCDISPLDTQHNKKHIGFEINCKIFHKKEFQNILSITEFNKLPISKIYILNNKIKSKINNRKFTKLHNINDTNKTWGTIEYCRNISEKIGKIFQKKKILT